MERKGKQKKTARNVIIILCVVLVAVSIPVFMALKKSHSQPTPAETTPTPTAPPAEETVSATPSIELPPYGGYSFDNDELVQLSQCETIYISKYGVREGYLRRELARKKKTIEPEK